MSTFDACWVVTDAGVHHLHIKAQVPLYEQCFKHEYRAACWYDEAFGRWRSMLEDDENTEVVHVTSRSEDPSAVYAARFHTTMRLLKQAQGHLNAAHAAVDALFEEST